MPMPYYQPSGYYPVMAQPWPGMSNFQPPNYGFRENSSSRLSPAHTPTSNDAQSNVNDDQREVSNRVGHRSAEKKKRFVIFLVLI
ncbi:unnamed protein product [Larinioides sclopetarius]|uniref:Uncharacterized protein n=1 Tax=Larinioides sclopetarius TaxID=280406 RepID=A0AAV2AUF3_9ARAC